MIRAIPVNDLGEVMLEQYQSLLGPRTRLVALTHASNSLGTLLPVAEMTHMARRSGARVLIDGAQTVAHVPVNVQQLDCDFYIFSGHKIFGPTRIGAFFAKQGLQVILPPRHGGGNMIRNVTFEETTYADPPAKFEAGTPNIADTVGLGAALAGVLQHPRRNRPAGRCIEPHSEHMSRRRRNLPSGMRLRASAAAGNCMRFSAVFTLAAILLSDCLPDRPLQMNPESPPIEPEKGT